MRAFYDPEEGLLSIEGLLQDVRYAARVLLNSDRRRRDQECVTD
jgi:hypothetical protein